jgi:ribose transport system substrate-binding protein
MGVVDAATECRRQKDIAVVGQEECSQALEELQSSESPLIGLISHEGHSYGPGLINLGILLASGEAVPPHNYVSHKAVSRNQIDSNAIPEPLERQRSKIGGRQIAL